MARREDLLAGAKACLYEKGYARTTARDIAAASGASLAAIGYHYGSMQALLSAALLDATGEWADELERAMGTAADAGKEPIEHFEETWARVIELFETHRPLWVASIEALAQLDHDPQLRQALVDVQHEAHMGLAEVFHGRTPGTADEAKTNALGAFYHALLIGVMAQWLIDPDQASTASGLTEALRTVAADAG